MCKARHCIACGGQFSRGKSLGGQCKAPICVCVNACKVQSVCVNELAVARQKLQSEMDSPCSGLLKQLLYTRITRVYARIYVYTQVYTLCGLTSFNYDNWRPHQVEESSRRHRGEMSCMKGNSQFRVNLPSP